MERGELRGARERRACKGRDKDFIFFLFASLSDLWKSDRKFSSGLKAKLIHVARATLGYQNLGVFSNSTRYGIFLLVLFLT